MNLTADQLSFLHSVDTPTIANAIEPLGVRDRADGYLGGNVQCQFPELGTMVGRALTVSVRDSQGVTGGGAGYWELWDALAATEDPTVIVMSDATGTPERIAFAGEIMCTLAKRLGAIGIATDGALRDIPEARALGFHYFMRFGVASHSWFDLFDVGEPVTIDGQQVRTGDILHGDCNGVTVVPDAVLAELPAAVETIRSREATLLSRIRSTDFDYAAFRSGTGY
jgi:4-hydroxy-4-methyl-2-oxoglutarate aldolase